MMRRRQVVFLVNDVDVRDAIVGRYGRTVEEHIVHAAA